MPDVFLDTAYAIALSSRNDSFHTRAVSLSEELESAGTQLVTTHAVILEIGNALARRRHRAAAIRLLNALVNDPTVRIIPISETLFARAFGLFSERGYKEWSLTDCMSFLVMQDHGISDALTTDEHFEQAGFRALLRDTSRGT